MLLDNTSLLGTASLLVAALAAATRPGAGWRGGAVGLAAMAAIIATGAVDATHAVVVAGLRSVGLYQGHVGVQWLLIVAGAVVAWVVGALIVRRRRGPARVMLLALLGLVAWFAVQGVSLHGADVVLSHPVGPVVVLGLGWLAGAIVVIAAAVGDARR